MRTQILAALISISTAAHAAPCADDYRRPEAITDGGSLVACWSPAGKCVTADGKQVAHPTVATTAPALRDRSRDRMDACLGDACKPVGAKLRAAVRRVTPTTQLLDPVMKTSVTVTRDLTLAIIDDGEHVTLWNIAGDRAIALGRDVVAVHVVGSALVASWAGNTLKPVDTLLDRQGRPLGSPFTSIATAVVDDLHVATLAGDGTLSVRDTRTGKETATLAVAPAMAFGSVTSLPDHRLGATWSQTSGAISVAVIDLAPKLARGPVQTFDSCPL